MAQKNKDGRSFRDKYKIYIAAGITAWIIFMFIHPVAVAGDAMAPTLKDGQIVIVSKERFKKEAPPLYSVVNFRRAFSEEGNPDANKIRRVAGVPGDTVEIQNGIFYRNGERLASPYEVCLPGEEMKPVTLKEGEIFVLGDNREQSVDSRRTGPLPMKDLRGVCSYVVWPLFEWEKINQARIGE